MQTRALRMISLLWLIGSTLADHDLATLLKAAFLDGFNLAYCLCNGKADNSCLGDELYAALETASLEWSKQLVESPSTTLYPYNKGFIPPEVVPREYSDEALRPHTPCGEAKIRKLNVKNDYLDLLKPPIDGLIAIPATKYTRFIVEQIAGKFRMGSIDEGIWKVPPRSSMCSFAIEHVLHWF
ncbi:hypothetical protein EWM64_g4884 [Hericium alpestre]|uniref:Uncharacterized protein n=1 Tax=Hericium alpestre TaxID=135208 RepID=A0A4Y9ZYG3_9AGAM|nr:hypothetical protein EWM64_g4884 [Hericium alpestre]